MAATTPPSTISSAPRKIKVGSAERWSSITDSPLRSPVNGLLSHVSPTPAAAVTTDAHTGNHDPQRMVFRRGAESLGSHCRRSKKEQPADMRVPIVPI
ncbi:hypothetical protein GCM10010112_40590 [Actinoplanes lobatus]|uniref:Uncharacterized protein n=1 Tax=Actinoplanes lobatus TaxID=113568 RepID=A0ABQ4ALZ1_9ACTN|nr:hypothetical protein GCM10010112_40590 [Actinoplanes lobatus]GIE42021.1 hypothetical protein Alo02nite_49190 [Actinoplanes lobatus]